MSIGVFGDSVAKGVVYDEDKGKYTYLKDCFVNVFSQSADLAVKNYARFGCTVTKGIEILAKHQEELSKYSYIVLEFGGNDCDLNWKEVAQSPEVLHQPKVPLAQFEACYKQMIDLIQSAGSTPVILSLPPLDARKFFIWVSKGLSKENILKYLGDVNYIYRWHESYNRAVAQIAGTYGVRFIDIRAAFLEKENFSDYLCSDGMHPNEKGHLLINQRIMQQIPSFLPM